MFMFRFNLNGKLRFMVSGVHNVLCTFPKLVKHESDLWEPNSGNMV